MIGLRAIAGSFLRSLLVLFGTAMVVFVLFNILPGDPASLLSGKRANAQQVALLRTELGLDEGKVSQLFHYFNDLSPLSFGSSEDLERWGGSIFSFEIAQTTVAVKFPYLRKSYVNGAPVSGIISNALVETLVLAISALLLSLIIGTLLGIWSVKRPDPAREHAITLIAASGMAIPSFLSAILIAWVFGYLLSSFTGLSMSGSLFVYDVYAGREVLALQNLILPMLALAIRPTSMIALLMQNSLQEIMKTDFIRTARSKGLKERTVIYRHALLNAIAPAVTASLTWLVSLLTGAIFVEYVFGWNGLGQVVISAIENYDFPVIMGVTLVVSAFFVLTNWFLDAIYPMLDPTVRMAEKGARA